MSTALIQESHQAPCYPAPGEEHTLPVELESRAREQVTGTSLDALGGMLADLLGGTGMQQGGMGVRTQVESLTGWVYVAVDRIRNAVARTPLRVYRNQQGGKPLEITDPSNPLSTLLRVPNPMDTRSEFWSQTITFYELAGNAFWLKVRDRLGRVRELWAIPPQYMRPLHTRDKILWGYEMDTGLGSPLPIPAEDVVHHRRPNPKDRFWGLGTLAAAAEAMRSSNAIKAAQLSSFSNDILSNLFFTTEQMLGETDWKRMVVQIYNRHSGVAKAGLPVLLYGGVKPAHTSRPPAEMSFRESSAFTRDEILAIFGVPPLLAGIVENANNSNTASQERVFAQYTVHPRLVHLQERINKDLVPELDASLECEFDNPVPDDLVMLETLDSKALASSKVTPNELRQRDGLPPQPWGEAPRWYIELTERGKRSASQQAGEPSDADPGQGGPAAGETQAKSNVQAGRPSPEPETAGRRSAPVIQAASGDSGQEAGGKRRQRHRQRYLAALARAVGGELDRLESQAVPTLRRYFARQAERVKARVREVYDFLPEDVGEQGESFLCAVDRLTRKVYCVCDGSGVPARLYADGTTVEQFGSEPARLGRFTRPAGCCYDQGEWMAVQVRRIPEPIEESLDDWDKAAEELAGRMLPKIEQALESGARSQLDELDDADAFNVNSPEAQEWLRKKQRDYWRDTVNETTKKLLSEKLAAVLDDKPTLKKLEQAVEEVMAGRIKSSAETIARTETIGAYNAGGDIVRSAAGVETKEWVSTLDGRTRFTHLAADGQTVPQAAAFLVGGEELSYPGDPRASVANIVNCRCTAVAVID